MLEGLDDDNDDDDNDDDSSQIKNKIDSKIDGDQVDFSYSCDQCHFKSKVFNEIKMHTKTFHKKISKNEKSRNKILTVDNVDRNIADDNPSFVYIKNIKYNLKDPLLTSKNINYWLFENWKYVWSDSVPYE